MYKKTEMIQHEHFNGIIEQMRSFREADFLCDITLVTNDRNFRAHSVVLAAASSVFRETLRQKSDIQTIQLTGFDSPTVEIALEVMYGGKMNLPDIYKNADKLEQLFTILQDLGLDTQKLNSCKINFHGVDSLGAGDESHENKLTCRSDIGTKPGQVVINVASNLLSSSLDDTEKNVDFRKSSTNTMEDDSISKALETEKHIPVASVTDYYYLPIKDEYCRTPMSRVKHATTVHESSLVSRIESPFKMSGNEKTLVPGVSVRDRTSICSYNRNLKINVKSSKVPHEKIVSKVNCAYVCALCNKSFSQPNHLHIHMRTHNGDRPYSCPVCDRRFTQSANLLRHEQMHTGNRPHLCDLCGKSFIQKITLRDHMAAQHRITPRVFSCKLCRATFDDRTELTNHVREDHPDEHRERTVPVDKTSLQKPYACTICFKLYATSGGLRMHTRVHGGTMFACNLCEKSYVNAALLRQHSATHSREKEFACTSCGKAFIYRNALHVHRRTHTGEKPYKCTVCGHAYTQYGHLQSHMKTHTGEKPHVCDVCGKCYRQKVDLNLHKRRLPCSGTSIVNFSV